MTKHISILRGINLGAHKKIGMPDLKALYESIGFEKVLKVTATTRNWKTVNKLLELAT